MYKIAHSVTTVGFGDQVPSLNNAVSMLTTVLAVILGSLFLSMPLAIIGNMFDATWRLQEAEENAGKPKLSAISSAKSSEDTSLICRQIEISNFVVLDDYFTLSTGIENLSTLVNRICFSVCWSSINIKLLSS